MVALASPSPVFAVLSLHAGPLFSVHYLVNKFPFPVRYSRDWLNVRLNALILQSQLHIAWLFSTKYLPFEQYGRAHLSSFSRNSICINCLVATILTFRKTHFGSHRTKWWICLCRFP